MFLFALGLLYGMFRRGDELNAWWTLLLGAMLSLTSIAVAVENITSVLKRENGNGKKRDDGDGESSTDTVQRILGAEDKEGGPGSGLLRVVTRRRKRGRTDQGEVAGSWDVDLPGLGGIYPGSVQ